MNRYALLITSSTTYFLGLNTLLNGLDYYGHNNIDVYVVYGDHMLEYLEYCKDKFCFPLNYVSILEYGDMESRCVIRGIPEVPYGVFDENSNACWAKYGFMIKELSKKYEAICYMDADCMLLNNIYNYFDEAISTGKIICPVNPRSGNLRLDAYKQCKSKEELHAKCKGHVVENFPVFYDPKKHNDVNQYVWDNRDKEAPNDPDLFNEALVVLDKLDEITYLPGSTWMGDFTYNIKYDETKYGEEYGIQDYLGERMNVWHSRFWRRDSNESLIRYAGDSKTATENAIHNVRVGESAVRFFNNHKVTFSNIASIGTRDYKWYMREWI